MAINNKLPEQDIDNNQEPDWEELHPDEIPPWEQVHSPNWEQPVPNYLEYADYEEINNRDTKEENTDKVIDTGNTQTTEEVQ